MARIGVTQRVSVIEDYGERRDCLDQAWTTLLESLGHEPIPLPNTPGDPETYLDSLGIAGLVLTGGNDLAHREDAQTAAPERDAFETAAIEWARDRDVPILGVCRGLQLLTVHFGGRLRTVEGHVAVDHGLEAAAGIDAVAGSAWLPDALPELLRDGSARSTVNSYHDYAIDPDGLADPMQALATAPDGTVELASHRAEPIVGVMWHPERDSPAADLDRQLFARLFGDVDR